MTFPRNREFGHFPVVSQSQVPREFGVNLNISHRDPRHVLNVVLFLIIVSLVLPDFC